jgi:hypothetical protein
VLADKDALAIGVDQDFLAVKAMSTRCITWSGNAVSVELPGLDSGDKDMPIMSSMVECWIELDDSRRLLGVSVIKENYLYMRGVGRENAEIYAGGS